MSEEKTDLKRGIEKRNEREQKFSKEQLLFSERFREKRDAVAALLEDGKKYSVDEAEEAIRIYRKRKVR